MYIQCVRVCVCVFVCVFVVCYKCVSIACKFIRAERGEEGG